MIKRILNWLAQYSPAYREQEKKHEDWRTVALDRDFYLQECIIALSKLYPSSVELTPDFDVYNPVTNIIIQLPTGQFSYRLPGQVLNRDNPRFQHLPFLTKKLEHDGHTQDQAWENLRNLQQRQEQPTGWTDWMHPVPGFQLECGDCGLTQELEHKVIRKTSDNPDGSWEADDVTDPDIRTVIRFCRHK